MEELYGKFKYAVGILPAGCYKSVLQGENMSRAACNIRPGCMTNTERHLGILYSKKKK